MSNAQQVSMRGSARFARRANQVRASFLLDPVKVAGAQSSCDAATAAARLDH
jgi:hypothetical protein